MLDSFMMSHRFLRLFLFCFIIFFLYALHIRSFWLIYGQVYWHFPFSSLFFLRVHPVVFLHQLLYFSVLNLSFCSSHCFYFSAEISHILRDCLQDYWPVLFKNAEFMEDTEDYGTVPDWRTLKNCND